MTSVCWIKSCFWAILEIRLLLADTFNKSLNILAAHQHVLIYIKHNYYCDNVFTSRNLAVLAMLELLLLSDVFACEIQSFISGWACYPDFEQKYIYLLASKTVKNRHHSSSNNYVWWMEFVCYLALSVYFIEIIQSIMFYKKKVAYEWEPCFRGSVHTQ